MARSDFVHGESLGGLLRGIVADIRMLIREEIALARVELRGQMGLARAAAVSFAIAAASLAVGGVFLLIASATALSELMGWPRWAGFLTIAVLLTVVGCVTLFAGRRQIRKVQTVPSQTVSTLKENVAWIAKRLSSGRR